MLSVRAWQLIKSENQPQPFILAGAHRSRSGFNNGVILTEVDAEKRGNDLWTLTSEEVWLAAFEERRLFSLSVRAAELHPSSNRLMNTLIKHFLLNQTCSSKCFKLRVLTEKERCDDFMYLYLAPSASDLYPHLASLNNMTASNYLPGCCFAPWQTLWYWLIFALWVSVVLLWRSARLSFSYYISSVLGLFLWRTQTARIKH